MTSIQDKYQKSFIDGTFLPLFYARDKDDLGIGDINSLFKSIKLTKLLNQNILEILPLNFSSAFESPYSVLSTKCFNTLYISHSLLNKIIDCKAALQFLKIYKKQIISLKTHKKVDYQAVRKIKIELFKLYYRSFIDDKKNAQLREVFKGFKKKNDDWLEDHLLYILLREKYFKENSLIGWDFRSWPDKIRNRDKNTIIQLKREYRKELDYESFLQWICYKQWSDVKKYAHSCKVALMGDIPFSVDGADIWLNPEVFALKKPALKRTFSQGVPPDMFSNFGQYWQFYSFNWDSSKTTQFQLDRLSWNQKLFSIIRLDHVLGYYRGYLFFEDPEQQSTFKNLGIWEQITPLIHQGHIYPHKQGDIAWEIYKIFLDALKKKGHLLSNIIEKEFFKDKEGYLLKENHMLLVARQAIGQEVPESWIRQVSVEKSVYEKIPVWDFLKISKEKSFQDHAKLTAYLFNHGKLAPKPDDSLRPCVFKKAPGEELIKKFLKQAKKKDSILVSEALGVVPDFIVKSLDTIGAINYIPLIYGLTPDDSNNLYFPVNHLKEAFVTFALHDSSTLYSWWISKPTAEKQKILDFIFGFNQEKAANHHYVNYKLQKEILSQVYKSKAFMKVLLWTDIFLSADEDAINKPGCERGQWLARMPLNADLDNLIQAAKNRKSTIEAKNAVNLIRDLKKIFPS